MASAWLLFAKHDQKESVSLLKRLLLFATQLINQKPVAISRSGSHRSLEINVSGEPSVSGPLTICFAEISVKPSFHLQSITTDFWTHSQR